MKMTEQEAHCIARLLQGVWYATQASEFGGLGSSMRAC